MTIRPQHAAPWISRPPTLRGVLPRTPDSLPGLVAWGEGSDLGADGSQIASWLNKTGSGLDPAQATAGNRPTVKANAINGQKAALFTAASAQGLMFPAGALSWYQSVAGATFAMVFKPVSVTVNAQVICVGRNADAANRASLILRTDSKISASIRSDDTTTSSTIGATTLSMGTSYIAAISADAFGGTASVMLQGTSDGSGSITPAQNFPNTTPSSIGLGARGDNTANFDGYIGAYAMWNVSYSAATLRPILQRWSSIYGIALS